MFLIQRFTCQNIFNLSFEMLFFTSHNRMIFTDVYPMVNITKCNFHHNFHNDYESLGGNVMPSGTSCSYNANQTASPPPCCFTFKYCTFCDRVSNVTTNNFVLRLNWSFGEILCSTKPVKMKIFSCNYQKKSLIDMEHDFVLKYQTSKISNIKIYPIISRHYI